MKRVLSFMIAAIMTIVLLPTVGMAEDNVKYLLRDVNDGSYTEVAMNRYKTYETEHFQIFYDTDGANSSKVTDAFLKQCETVLENCWDLYMVKMGMEPTSTSVLPNGDKVTQYKTNVILMGTGVEHYDLGANEWGAYGSVDTAGYPYFMCCLAAMNSPSVVAHEFGHSTHYAQGDNAWQDNIYMGPWFEAVANWFAEQYIYEYMSPDMTQLSSLYLRATHLTKMNGRGYYEAWPILQYLHEDPDETGVYGEKFVQKLLGTNLGSTEVLMWEVLEKANGEELTVADTVGMYASHMATMDFDKKAYYNARINAEMNGKTLYWQQRYTPLEELDGENTYAVPIEKAPQAMGYNIIPLTFKPGEVKVKVNALTDVKGADWRARLVLERGGKTSYSELFGEGEEMKIEAMEGDALYLTVAATPAIDTIVKHTVGGWATHSTETNMPFEDKTQYPYSVTMENATPMERPNTGFGMMTIHPNGGGRKSFSARVSDSAYIGKNAIVWGNATVSDNAVIDGYAIVGGNAVVKDNAYVGDYAIVYDRAVISGNARVIENACVYVDYKVGENAVVKGSSLGLYNGSATGSAITYGDWFEDMGYNVADGSFSGYHSVSSDAKYAPVVIEGKNVRGNVPGLVARYEFDGNLRDTVAYSDAYGVNDPVVDDEGVTFSGDNYVVLNESVLMYDNARLHLSAQGEGDVLTLGDIVVNMSTDKVKLTCGENEISVNKKEGFNVIEIIFDENTIKMNGKAMECDVTLSEAVREGRILIGYGFEGKVDYLRVYNEEYGKDAAFRPAEGLSTVFASDDSTGTLFRAGLDQSSAWYGWGAAGDAITVNGGLNVTGAGTGTISTPWYKTDKFVIEFEPEGGKAYPDHGITDIGGKVLFAHRYATDANAIHAGRGEINDAVRGSAFVTDSAGQKRLGNFVAEKLYAKSSRSDRGTVEYKKGDTVRIIAENRRWNEEMAELFSKGENVSGNLDDMTIGEEVYTVTYALLENGLEMPASVSVYKGNFEGFGGFFVSGGAAGVTVSYKNMTVAIYKEAILTENDGYVIAEGFEGEGVMIFSVFEGDILKRVKTIPFEGDEEVMIPEGFEKSTVMAFDSTKSLVPLTSRKNIGK